MGWLSQSESVLMLVSGRIAALKLLVIQSGFVAIACLIAGLGWGWAAGYSAGVGGAICFIPNLYFTLKVFSAHEPRQMLNAFYLGEAVKLILTALLFMLAWQFLELLPLAVLCGFIFTQLAHWCAPILFNWHR